MQFDGKDTDYSCYDLFFVFQLKDQSRHDIGEVRATVLQIL